MTKIAVLGAGVMGSALAIPLADNGHEVAIVGTEYDTATIDSLRTTGIHPGLKLRMPAGVSAYPLDEAQEAFDGASVVIVGVASVGVAWAGTILADLLQPGTSVLTVTKGLLADEDGNFYSLPEAMEAALPPELAATTYWAAACGPSIAREVALRVDTAVIFAGPKKKANEALADIFRTDRYHVWTTTDTIGAEVCAATKNVYAFAVGIGQGIGSVALAESEITHAGPTPPQGMSSAGIGKKADEKAGGIGSGKGTREEAVAASSSSSTSNETPQEAADHATVASGSSGDASQNSALSPLTEAATATSTGKGTGSNEGTTSDAGNEEAADLTDHLVEVASAVADSASTAAVEVGGGAVAAMARAFAMLGLASAEPLAWNPSSAIFAQGSREMREFVKLAGGKVATVRGLGGVGDLFVTCTGGRNVQAGRYIGAGASFTEVQNVLMKGVTIEGVSALESIGSALTRLTDRGVVGAHEYPLFRYLYAVVIENKPEQIPWDKFYGGYGED